MNLRDLAKAANVSVSTASKALNGSKELNDETIAHVLKVAKECEYFVEKKKQRKSVTKKLGQVIIVVPEIISVYYSTIATELTHRIRSVGFDARVYLYNFVAEYRSAIFHESLYDDAVVGIISVDCNFDAFEIGDFPIIKLGTKYSNNSNDFDMIVKVFEHLVSLGHKKIYYFGEKLTLSREKFFLQAAKKLELDLNLCKTFVSNYRFEKAGYKLAEEIIKTDDIPTAIVAAYDEIAFGAISALTANGCKVPEDVSVVGINNVPAAEFFTVPLTTFGASSNDFIEDAARTLENLLLGKNANEIIPVKRDLFIRKSTAKAKGI